MIEITGVKVLGGDQPVAISYKGEEKKTWKPCKSMRRILAYAWGMDGDDYIGRKVLLYNDKAVTWAGAEVGGIRVSKMSHIEKTIKISLNLNSKKKGLFVIEPLIEDYKNVLTPEAVVQWNAKIDSAESVNALCEVSMQIKNMGYEKGEQKELVAYGAEAMAKLKEAAE